MKADPTTGKRTQRLPGGGLVKRRLLILLSILIVYGAVYLILGYGGFERRVAVSSLVMPVVTEYDSPLERPTGLAFDGENLWISSTKEHRICSMDPETGSLLRELNVSIASPWGLAWGVDCLWVADFDTLRIYRVDVESGRITQNIVAPGTAPTGLSWDGASLWVSDFSSHRFYKLDSTSGAVLRSFETPAPGYNPSGLAWDGGSLWVADMSASYVFRVEPVGGGVVSSYYSPGYYPSDLAWDGEHLWVLDYSKSAVYEAVPGEQAYETTRLSVPTWFWLALTMSILPVMLSIVSAVRRREGLGAPGEGRGRRAVTFSSIAMMIAIVCSAYSSYELFRIIYSVVVLGKIVFRGDRPLWLYRFEILLCLYSLCYWVWFGLGRVLGALKGGEGS